MSGVSVVWLALALDLTLGEPPRRLHPVAWFGCLVGSLDREWSRPRGVGLGGVVVLPLAAAVGVGGAVGVVSQYSPPAGILLAGVGLFVTTSFRRLLVTATSVSDATATDLDTARSDLRALAGRDASALSAGQVRSGTVESIAENLADGLVAPLGALAVGVWISLAAGWHPENAVAAGLGCAAWVKAVNTMDSMLGYRSKPVGWASARLDDLVMWLPARASAVLLAVAAGRPLSPARAGEWLPSVPSPNSGWPMGVLAGALDVRLEKPGVYVLNPEADLPSVAATRRGIRIVGIAGLLAYAGVGGGLALSEVMFA